MFKPTFYKVILWLIIGMGAFVVCARNHVAMFPCEVTSAEITQENTASENGMCTARDLSRLRDDGTTATMTAAGWAQCFVLFVLIPLVLGFVIGHFIVKPSDREKS